MGKGQKNMETNYKTRTVAGREIPEFILLENGALFTEKWIKEEEAKRPFLPESVLRGMAAEIATHITIRTEENGCTRDTQRESTKAEQDTLYKLALSALLGLNHGEEARQSKAAEDAIINSIEYTLILMIPNANSYDSIYLPLRRAVENWRNHTEAELVLHYGEC